MKYVLILMLFAIVGCAKESHTDENFFGADAAAASSESSFADGEWSFYIGSSAGPTAKDMIIRNGKFTITQYWHESGRMNKRVISGSIRKTSEGIDLIATTPSCFGGRVFGMIIYGVNQDTSQRLLVGHQSQFEYHNKGLGPGYPSAVEVDACLLAAKDNAQKRIPANAKGKTK